MKRYSMHPYNDQNIVLYISENEELLKIEISNIQTCSELDKEPPGFWTQALKHLSDNFLNKLKSKQLSFCSKILLEEVPEHFEELIVVVLKLLFVGVD